jgi:hypothetical protein
VQCSVHRSAFLGCEQQQRRRWHFAALTTTPLLPASEEKFSRGVVPFPGGAPARNALCRPGWDIQQCHRASRRSRHGHACALPL